MDCLKLKKTPVLLILALALSVPGLEAAAQGCWTSKASMFTPRNSVATAVLNGLIFGAGGCCPIAGPHEVYNPQMNVWAIASPMPIAVASLAGVTFNGLMYVIGGNASGACTSAVQIYNPTAGWSLGTSPMPTPRCSLGLALLNGRIYAVGGTNTSGNPNYATVEVYNPATNTWSGSPSMLSTRSSPMTAVVGGLLYVMGGTPSGGPPSATVEVFDPGTNLWTPRAPMSVSRSGGAAAVLNGIIYATGGVTGSPSTVLSSVEAYDPATNLWSPRASLPAPRFAHGIAAVGGVLYAIGGSDAVTHYATTFAYNPNTLSISAPFGPGSIRFENSLCAPGSIYATAVSVNTPGRFPSGWFFGVDITIPLFLIEMSAGPPFYGLLTANGTSTLTLPAGIPAGLQLNAVTAAFDPGTGLFQLASPPISFLTP